MSRLLELVLPLAAIDEFAGLFQAGVKISSREGLTVAAFLVDDLGLDRHIVSERIGTVILNGRPIDDLEGSFLTGGCTLSLSAAMPGLVGASLRRGGPLGAMRSSISRGSRPAAAAGSPATIILKLFNLLVGELGPIVLMRGVSMTGKEMRLFMGERSPAFLEGCSEISLDGIGLARHELESHLGAGDTRALYTLVVRFTGWW